MYMIFQKIVKGRKATGHREEDALQYLLDQGDDMNMIISVSRMCLMIHVLLLTA